MSAPLPMAGSEARAVAIAMTSTLRETAGQPLRFGGIDLAPAVEQVFFSVLRTGDITGDGGWHRVLKRLRRPAVAIASVRAPDVKLRAADVMVLLLAAVHRDLFAPVGSSIERLHPGLRVVEVAAGRAARDPHLADLPAAHRQLSMWTALALLRHRVDRRAVAASTRSWDGLVGRTEAVALRALAVESIVRMAVEAGRLDAVVAAARPRVVVTYDEVDAWGRLLASVAHRHGAMAVDLPHAEAVDIEAIRGAAFDWMGVYGPRAAAVVEAAGVPRDRIQIVGPARFDSLVQAPRMGMDRPPRVILAAQYRTGRMTDAVRSGILACAAAAARAVGGVVQIQPHPVEPVSAWEEIVLATPLEADVEIRVERGQLHDLLPGAALLVTGWSNSVYEAVLAGVPALTVHLSDGEPPMPFAAEAIAGEARSLSDAAELARAFTEPVNREVALSAARRGLEAHLGPLDGLAAERTAGLLVRALEH